MNCFERMAIQLKATKLYRMDGTSLIDAEMKAYASGLDMVFLELEQLVGNSFFDDPYGAYAPYYEWLFCLKKSDPPSIGGAVEKRKQKIQMMKQRLGVCNRDFTSAGIKKAAESGGLTVNFIENFAEKKIVVQVLADANVIATQGEKVDFIKQFLPCHSTAEVVFV